MIKKPYLDYFIGWIMVRLMYLLQIVPTLIAEIFESEPPFYYGSSWLWTGLTSKNRNKRLPYNVVMIDTSPKNAKTWIYENLNISSEIHFSHIHRCFSFYYAEDAMAFKLRWV